MDEAERCHALAILDRGRLVAEGSPRELVDRIGAVVLEIESRRRARARARSTAPDSWSVAQLGTRLHALIDPNVRDPAEAVRARCRAPVSREVERVREASLEDVFVAATPLQRGDAP